ncbi:hypothetical protein ABEX78_21905 [Priestia megaterium]
MSAHDFYTIVQQNKQGDLGFFEAVDFREFEEYMKDTIRIYEKNTDISHQQFAQVPNNVEGLWFVATLNKKEQLAGYEFRTAGELRAQMSTLLNEALKYGDYHIEHSVVIYPPTARLVEESMWRHKLETCL